MTGGPDGTNKRTLRATQAYRLEDDEWRLILRHANRVSDEDEARERQLLGDGSDDTD